MNLIEWASHSPSPRRTMRTIPVRLLRGTAGTRHRYVAAALLAVIILSGCSHKGPGKDWQAIVNTVQTRFAPDARLAVFRVDVRTDGDRMVANGEVESKATKTELLRLLREAAGEPIADAIRVLPDPDLGAGNSGLVNISVGNVRREPDHAAELVTQVLLGETVELLKKDGGWYYIHCPDRYLGWVDEEAVLTVDASKVTEWNAADLYRVVSQYALLRTGPKADAAPVCDVTAGDLIRRAAEKGIWLEASLPDGRSGFIESAAVMNDQSWRRSRKLTPENIEATARFFMGVPYLWGGTSPKGFDCSGFVKTVFFLNGTSLNRDADQQAGQGEDVSAGPAFQNLKRGDLLFFGERASGDKPERIVHVGIYLTGRKFIHCSGRVRVSSLDPASPDYDEWHAKGFVRARRFVAP